MKDQLLQIQQIQEQKITQNEEFTIPTVTSSVLTYDFSQPPRPQPTLTNDNVQEKLQEIEKITKWNSHELSEEVKRQILTMIINTKDLNAEKTFSEDNAGINIFLDKLNISQLRNISAILYSQIK